MDAIFIKVLALALAPGADFIKHFTDVNSTDVDFTDVTVTDVEFLRT